MATAAVARRVASRIPSFTVSSEPAAAASLASSILLPGQNKVICRWWRGAEAEPVVDPSRYLIDGRDGAVVLGHGTDLVRIGVAVGAGLAFGPVRGCEHVLGFLHEDECRVVEVIKLKRLGFHGAEMPTRGIPRLLAMAM